MVARCLLEAVLFAVLVAALDRIAGAGRPAPLAAVALALWGAALMLSAALRGGRSEGAAARLAIAVALAGAAGGLLLDPEARGPALLARLVGFGILAEGFLWRLVSVARDPARWREAGAAWLHAGIGLSLGAFVPQPFDSAALVPLAFASLIAGGAALSLARAAQELPDEPAARRGIPMPVAAGAGTILLGAGALVVALFEPAAQDALARAASALGEAVGRALVVVIFPLALVAGWLTEALRALAGGRRPLFVDLGAFAGGRGEEEANLRAMEALRPFVVGLGEVVLALAAVALGFVLVERIARERRAALPPGASLERASIDGIGLGALLLAALRPERPARRRPPPDDGSPAAAARILYWRFLALAERAGAGWRAPEETPLEHARRLARLDPGWEGAAPLVDAFDTTRYAERAPDRAALAAAGVALGALERAAAGRGGR